MKRTEDQRTIGKAKRCLMRVLRLSEGDSYRALRRAAMDRRVPLAVLAQQVLTRGPERMGRIVEKGLLRAASGWSRSTSLLPLPRLLPAPAHRLGP